MGKRKKRISLFLTVGPLIIILGALALFLSLIFEGERPKLTVTPLPEFLSGSRVLNIAAEDRGRGLRRLLVTMSQEGRKKTILDRLFAFRGLLNRSGTHRFQTGVPIDPSRLNLTQGRADLEVRVWDSSRRNGGDGNLSIVLHSMIVDTIPPAVRAVSRQHYVNLGGTGLVVYQASSDTAESGLYVGKIFFPGYPAGKTARPGIHVCYFTVPFDTRGSPDIYLWARDRAGNQSRGGLYYHVRRRTFRQARLNITDRFLKRVLPSFTGYPFDPGSSDIDRFLKINRELRRENTRMFRELKSKTVPERLWDGAWIRLGNSATMARFADHRTYFYKGKKIDEQTHLGVDLASLAHARVPAANNGRVIFAGPVGIYGLTVVLDHGQGIASTYSHLSSISVAMDQQVTKGETLGFTGQTGLAAGDHLHFGVMVNGIFVNPVEWWDGHWIRDNITRKLAPLEK